MAFAAELALRVALLSVPAPQQAEFEADFDNEFSDIEALKSLANAVAEGMTSFTRSLGLTQSAEAAVNAVNAGAGNTPTNSQPSQG